MPEAMGYEMDDTRWPLLVARATEHLGDAAATEASYRKLEAILLREQRFMVVFDLRGASSTPDRRRKFFEWGKRNADSLKRLIVASAIIAGSSIERGFVTAGLWVSTPPWPMRVFATSSEAEAWLLANYAHLTSQNRA
ncbi:MAG: hypothetical protein RL701_7242 [Pseudomonadota bacterium]|jgi:hypothetical protein